MITLKIEEIKKFWEEKEKELLSPYATLSSQTKGRKYPEAECDLRNVFQRDRDRIIHSKAFRRLKHKTQVFLSPEGDHYRTRLTHTLEVAQIARTIARALRLNEDLTEAIALGHDLGHTPFGHAGEEALNEVYPEGFRHNEQSLRVVDLLERGGQGLNLTWEVRNGILKHSKTYSNTLLCSEEDLPATLEGQVVRLADVIAYVNHDIDDALRAGLIREAELPKKSIAILGSTHRQRIDHMVKDVVLNSIGSNRIAMSQETRKATEELRSFLFQRVYFSGEQVKVRSKAKRLIKDLYFFFLEHPDFFQKECSFCLPKEVSPDRIICDFISGMTDRYALYMYKKYFLPDPWPQQGSGPGNRETNGKAK